VQVHVKIKVTVTVAVAVAVAPRLSLEVPLSIALTLAYFLPSHPPPLDIHHTFPLVAKASPTPPQLPTIPRTARP
jgi:hypothetical protein